MADREKKYKKYKQFIIVGVVSIGLFFVSYYIYTGNKNSDKFYTISEKRKELTTNNDTLRDKDVKIENTVLVKNKQAGSKIEIPQGPGVQTIDNISKQNGDCSYPIIITDSIVVSIASPKGFGKNIEIQGNKADDTLHFEKEHNTMWYRFKALESGNLTFDIIPLNLEDDYDFMLFKYNGPDLCTRVVSKQVTPLRTCISRNDKKNQSQTGLTLNEYAKSYVHSGAGSSYVKYIFVEKGEIYYLLLDNVYNNGNGHIIRFHYKTFAPNELYVGKVIPLDQIRFKDSDTEFRAGSEKALDSLYLFLIKNPLLKIEIQGHVNSGGGNSPIQIKGKPNYTFLQLSEQRAMAIYDFLIARGIDKRRLSTVGFGSTKMKIPNPQTRSDFIINARAEILIVSLDYRKEK